MSNVYGCALATRGRCAALAAVVAATLSWSPAAAAQLYKCIEAGRVVYTDAPCASTPARPGTAARGKISRAQIEAMLAATDKAAARMDYETILGYYAEDAVIDLEIRDAARSGRSTLGKAQYRRLLIENRDKIWNYGFKREQTDIAIEPDATRARIELQYTERWHDPGGAMTIRSRGSAWVEMRGGKPRITSLHVVSTAPQPQTRVQP